MGGGESWSAFDGDHHHHGDDDKKDEHGFVPTCLLVSSLRACSNFSSCGASLHNPHELDPLNVDFAGSSSDRRGSLDGRFPLGYAILLSR
jgi:uncharacterized OsmC-like protein